MDAGFWHRRWTKNEIGFHLDQVNPLLVEYFSRLSLESGASVFLPLCGKTRDIAWLLNEGFCVVGAELNQQAVEQLFVELELEPTIERFGELLLYQAPNLDVWCGDMFALNAEQIGKVNAVYDRAALVALPEDMRLDYAPKVVALSRGVPQLLITLEYDQSLQAGPPFSISDEALNRYYAQSYELELVLSQDVAGGLKGKSPAIEKVWLLTPRQTSGAL